jgi:anti-anti-sigma factor
MHRNQRSEKKGEFVMLNVQRKNLGTVSLLNLDGNVVIGETETLRDVFQTLPPSSSVILDLSHVTLLDAHGLGVLLHLREQAQARDMQLELANIGAHLREIFRITRLDSVFQISTGVEYLPVRATLRRIPVAA